MSEKYYVDVRNFKDESFGCWNCILAHPDSYNHGRTHMCLKLVCAIPASIMVDGGTMADCPAETKGATK